MEGINLNYVLQVGEDLGRLITKDEFSVEDLAQVEMSLWILYKQKMYDIRPAFEKIRELYELLQEHTKKDFTESQKIDNPDAKIIKNAAGGM